MEPDVDPFVPGQLIYGYHPPQCYDASLALRIARAVHDALPERGRECLKSIHVVMRLHMGMLTVRCHFIPDVAQDPDPYIFTVEELQDAPQ